MPSLADTERRRRCYRCKSTDHKVSQCPKKKRSDKKPARRTLVERMEPQEDLTVIGTLRANTEQMGLYERVALLDRMEWAPEVCSTCGKQDPKHSNLECPKYEQCQRCRGTRAYGYVKHHTCYPKTPDLESYNTEYNDCDFDLYWDNNE